MGAFFLALVLIALYPFAAECWKRGCQRRWPGDDDPEDDQESGDLPIG